MSIKELLQTVVQRGASDLHIKAGAKPMLRIDGALVPISEERLQDEQVRALVAELLTGEQLETFYRKLELDLAYSLPGYSRFRVNIYQQRGGIGAAIRTIPHSVPTYENCTFPKWSKPSPRFPEG